MPPQDFGKLLEDLVNQRLIRGGEPPLGTKPLDLSRGPANVERNVFEQIPAGLARGLVGVGETLGEAIELVAPEAGISKFFDDLQNSIAPPSGGVVEQAAESVTQSLGTLAGLAGLATAAAPAVGLGTLGFGTALIGTGLVGVPLVFGAAEATRTREFLNGINDQLVRRGQSPLTDGEIATAMASNAVIEAGGEALANFILAKRLTAGSPALRAVKQGVKHFFNSKSVNEAIKATARATSAVGRAAAREALTEAGQAAGQAGVIRGVLREKAPETRLQTPTEAALQAAQPAALAGAFFGGVEIGSTFLRDRRVQQQPTQQGVEEARETVVESEVRIDENPFEDVELGTRSREVALGPGNFERIAQAPDGRRGIVLTDESGALQFQVDSPAAPLDAPGVPIVEMTDADFSLVFGTPAQGIDPTAINRRRRHFAASQNLDLETLPDVQIPLAQRSQRTARPPATQETEDRLIEAEISAIEILTSIRAAGDAPFSATNLVETARRIQQDFRVTEEEAREIVGAAKTELSREIEADLTLAAETSATEEAERVAAQQSNEDIALGIVEELEGLDPATPGIPNRRTNRDAFSLVINLGTEMLVERTGISVRRARRLMDEMLTFGTQQQPAPAPEAQLDLARDAQPVPQTTLAEEVREATEQPIDRRPLSQRPAQELELQEFIRVLTGQRGININLETDVPGELRAAAQNLQTGTTGLLGTTGDVTLLQAATEAQELGFITEQDLEAANGRITDALINKIGQSVGGQPVVSVRNEAAENAQQDRFTREQFQREAQLNAPVADAVERANTQNVELIDRATLERLGFIGPEIRVILDRLEALEIESAEFGQQVGESYLVSDIEAALGGEVAVPSQAEAIPSGPGQFLETTAEGLNIFVAGPPGAQKWGLVAPDGRILANLNSLEGARQHSAENFSTGPPTDPRFSLRQPPPGSEITDAPLDPELFRTAFRASDVTANEDGTLSLNTRNGTVTVSRVSRIGVDQAAVELAYNRPPTPAEIEAGASAQIQSKNGVFEVLVTPQATEEVIFHEAGHFFEDSGFLNTPEVGTLNAALRRRGIEQTIENRADFLGERLQQEARKNPVGQIVRKVQRFMDRLAQAVGIQTSGQVVRRIVRQGEAAQSTEGLVATEQEGPQRFALSGRRPPTVEGQQRQFRVITPVIENKLYREYAAIANIFSQSTRQQFNQVAPKERISIPDMKREAAAIMEEWAENPNTLRLRMAAWNVGKGIPSEFEAMALIGMTGGMWQDRFDAKERGEIRQEQFDQFEGEWFQLGGLVEFARQGVSSAGRLLRFSRESMGVSTYQAAMGKLFEKRDKLTGEQFDILQRQIQRAYQSGDRATLRNLGHQLEDPTLRDYYFEFFYGSVLSSPNTFGINLFGTLGFITFHNAVVRGTTALLDPVVAKLQGRARQHYVQEVLPALVTGELKNIPKGVKRFWALYRGKETSDEITKFRRDIGGAGGSWARAVHLSNIPLLGITKGQPVTWMRRFAPLITYASRGLEAADVALRELAYSTELEARAVRASIQQLGKRDTNFETDYINTVQDRPAEVRELLKIAQELTFTDAPSALAQFLMRSRQLPVFGPFLQMLIPFASTPDRLLARGFEFVPGATLIPTIWNGVNWRGYLPGETGPRGLTQAFKEDPKIAEVFAKQLIGVIMAMSMFALWKAGRLIGDVPDEEAEREQFFRSGKLPFSYISEGGTVVQWRRFEPLALPLGIALSGFTSIDKIQKEREEKGEALFSRGVAGDVDDTVSIAAAVAHAMTYYIVDGSYFRGLAEFMGGTTRRSSGNIQRGLIRQFVSATVPFSSAQRSLIRLQDSLTSGGDIFIREEGTVTQQFQQAVAVAPRSPTRINVLGEPARQRPAQGRFEAIGLPLPIRTSTLTDDPVENALLDVDFSPGLPSRSDLRRALKRNVSDDEFREFVINRGQMARRRLQRLIDAPFFDRLSKEQKASRFRAVFRQSSRRARRDLQLASR